MHMKVKSFVHNSRKSKYLYHLKLRYNLFFTIPQVAEPCDPGGGASQAGDRVPQLLQDGGASVQRPRLPREGVQARGRLALQVPVPEIYFRNGVPL